MKTPPETRIHTPINLYTYIQKARQTENLARQIAHKEEDLSILERLNELYRRIGCTCMLERSQKRADALIEEIFLLMHNKYRLEAQLLEFEIASWFED